MIWKLKLTIVGDFSEVILRSLY